ncbi:MAG: prolipoprotein diacylglyceryl transferase [Parcubacteria group bacterium Gr01-1014_18]|nr:MAG: prolipoprotein diacylglyceryl transferase [Parcubacteria group bacterium Greene0416_36]TSC80841.1 MAG: prolipoprotein diacylglyceryl transferase [Parcubacteria group bacterium Gr01-1014_18]TSC99502.1 MAG: prolipoprotein diacylglyceryl transferase [Parcubacteria group bacterium Greene1014_20]TSD07579.1 MAG: prolipoprotein diacylglyceryl transferase [Parcubacteria group bacterium Greene0714_2]
MIPYFYWNTFYVGGITFYMWGTLVALGILVGILACSWAARRNKEVVHAIWNDYFWVIVGGLIGARIAHVFLYDWAYYSQHLPEIFQIWKGGFSSIGSIAGGLFIFFLLGHWRKWNIPQMADYFIFGLPLGIGIGRLGCFFIHDHPGIETSFFMGVRFPDGIIRHDLGLYLSIQGFLIFIVFLFLYQKYQDKKAGLYLGAFALLYGISRFFLDFLRISESLGGDIRYGFLTPAQWGSLVLSVAGVYWLLQISKSHSIVKE